MEAVGPLSPLDVVKGEIQERIGQFLGLRNALIKLMRHGDLQIRTQAESLFGLQKALESDLSPVLEQIKQLQSGAWSYGDITDITTYSMRLLRQIKDVQRLERNAGQTVIDTRIEPDRPTGVAAIPWWVWATGGGLVLYMLS